MASANLKVKNGNYYAVVSKRDEASKSGYKNVWIPLGKDAFEAERLIEEHRSDRLNLLDRFAIPTPVTGNSNRRKSRKVIMLQEMVVRYLDFLEAHRNILTKRAYTWRLKDFCHVYLVRDINLFNITSEMIENYTADLRKRNWAKDTIVNSIGVIGRFFKWMKKKGYVDFNPVDEAEKPKRERNRLPKYLNDEQIAFLFEIIGAFKREFIRSRNHLLFTLMLKTGLRRQETCDLTWHRVDLTNRRIFVKEGKLGKDGWIPISDGLLRELQSYRYRDRSQYVVCSVNGKKLYPSTIYSIFSKVNRKFIQRYPETRIHPHLLRHTFASTLARKGMPLQKIQLAMRHKTIDMTMRYAHLSPDSIQKEINLVD